MFRVCENYQSYPKSGYPKFHGPYESYEEAREAKKQLKITSDGTPSGCDMDIQVEAAGIWFLSGLKSNHQHPEYEQVPNESA